MEVVFCEKNKTVYRQKMWKLLFAQVPRSLQYVVLIPRVSDIGQLVFDIQVCEKI